MRKGKAAKKVQLTKMLENEGGRLCLTHLIAIPWQDASTNQLFGHLFIPATSSSFIGGEALLRYN